VTTPAAEMTEACINTLLRFQIFLISRARFSYFINFSVSVLETLWVKGSAVSATSSFLFFLLMNTVLGLLKVDHCNTYDRSVPLLLLLLLLLSSSFTFIYLKQATLFLEYIVLQLFCIYNLCYLLICSLHGAESFLKS